MSTWTDEDRRKVKELAASMTAAQIAVHMKRGVTSVKSFLSRQNIPLRRGDGQTRWTEEQVEKAHRLSAANATCAEIAAAIGRSPAAVYKGMEKRGLSLKHGYKSWSAEEEALLRTQSATMTAAKLAQKMGRTKRAIYHKAENLGIQIRSAVPTLRDHESSKRARQVPRPKASKPVSIERARPDRSKAEYVSRITWCPSCSAPVVNTWEGWAGHRERVGCGMARKPVFPMSQTYRREERSA